MRRDVQLYIQRDKEFVGSIGEQNLVTDGNFINGSAEWSETSGVSYVNGAAIVDSSSVTNELLYSESSTSKTKQNVTLTDNSAISPNGELTAIKVTDDSVNFRHRFWANNVSVTSGNEYTISFYVKKNSPNRYIYINAGLLGTNGSFSLDDQSTTGSVEVFETLNNDWYRIGLTGTAPTTTTSIWFLQMQLGTTDANYIGDGSSFYVWGLQFEQGSYPASYIKTEGSTETENANDSLNQTIAFTDGQKYRVTADIFCPRDENNNFLQSDDVTNVVWGYINLVVADGEIKQNSANSSRYLRQDTSVTSGLDYTVSFYLKYNGQQYVQITGSTGFSAYYANFDLVNGTVTSNPNNITVSIEPKDDGYYRISYTDTATSTSSSGRYILGFIPSGTSGRLASFQGDNASGVFIKHAMMDQSSELRDYVATTNSAIDTTGSAGNDVKLQDNYFDLGGLLSTDTTFTLLEGFNRVSYDFTANSNSDKILISGDTDSVDYTFHVSNVELREVTDSYSTYENVKVDMFDFEDINITDKIKDIRDISKVFTGFSQQFTVPASKTNNNLFSHFYNADVVSGFDQRIKHKAFIKIGGADYKEGRISLTGSSVQNGRPYSYSIVFYGKTVELKDLIGDDELKDLTGTLLDGFTFNYSSNIVNNGLSYGFDFQEYNQTLNTTTLNTDGNPDLFFPLISSENYYFYDSGDGINPKDRVESRNLLPSATTSPRGFYYKDLKPAIKVKFIIRAIQEKYGITFSDDFFNENNEQYEKLSMLLHREKGNIDNQLDDVSEIVSLSDLDVTTIGLGPTNDRRGNIYLPYNNVLLESDYPESLDFLHAYRRASVHLDGSSDQFGNPIYRWRDEIYTFRINLDVAVVGSGEYTVEIYDGNNDNFKKSLTTTGNVSNFEWELPMEYYNNVGTNHSEKIYYTVFYPKIKVSSQGGVSEATISNIKIERVRKRVYESQQNPWPNSPFVSFGNARYSYPDNPIQLTTATASLGVDLLTQMPKIKTLEFLTGIFKLFNLTAYYVQDNGLSEYNGQIRVRSIDSYYFDGKNIDLTRYVSTDNTQVNRNNLYSSIEFRYDKPKTLAITKANERTGDDFGDELLNNLNSDIYNPLAFDGGKYNIKLPFEKVMYERMNDQSTENHILPIQWGWLANKDENPITTKPLLFYAELEENIDTDLDSTGNNVEILLDNSVYDKNGNNTSASYTIVDRYLRPSSSVGNTRKTLHFGSEFDEWYIWEGEDSEEFGLFSTYYKRYLLQIYDRQSRIVKTSAHLPVNIMTKLNMNDVVIINGRRYRLNSLQLNLSTGKADLELMNDIAYARFDINKPSINVVQDNGTSLFIFKGATDEGYMENLRWNIYVNDALHQNYAYAAQMTLSVADFGAGSHEVYVTAVLDDVESQPSDVYTFTLS